MVEDKNKDKLLQVMEFPLDESEGTPDMPSSLTPSAIAKRFAKNKMYLAVLAIGIVFVFGVLYFSGAFTGMAVGGGLSPEEAGQNAVNFVNDYLTEGGGVAFDSVTEESGLYRVSTLYQNQSIDVYTTKDGKFVILPSGIINVAEYTAAVVAAEQQQEQPTAVPKTDKPVVELFIWSYCPYGIQAQGPLAEVASLLGGNADFEAVLYYDGHGAYETQQNKIQACIQKVDKDKYWQYAAGFVKDIYPNCGSSRDVECDKSESVKLMKTLGIDDSVVMSCVEDEGADLISAHSARAGAYGVTGSPSLLINGVKVNTARNAEAFKAAVCDAFTTPPAECGQTLSAESAATGTASCG